jgi:hypothetical protein
MSYPKAGRFMEFHLWQKVGIGTIGIINDLCNERHTI